MTRKEEEFQKRLLSTFKIEADEHLKTISSGLLELEKAEVENQNGIIEVLFREAHSLKGAARAVNKTDIESVCQALEGVFAGLKRKELPASSVSFDVLHDVIDNLRALISSDFATREVSITTLIGNVKGLQSSRTDTELLTERRIKRTLPQHAAESSDTIRMKAAKLDALLVQTEELIPWKLASTHHALELQRVNSSLNLWKKEYARLQSSKILRRQNADRRESSDKETTRLLEFLAWNEIYLKNLESKLDEIGRSVEQNHRMFGKSLDFLLEETRRSFLFPFSSLVDILPKLVRDLSRDQKKSVDLIISGGEVELDRRILEEMKGPLIHLVRNSIDHGIEDPVSREKNNKPATGKLTIALSQKNGSRVEITVSDDGAGIDLAKVKSASIKLGIVSREEAETLSPGEIVQLVFHSGVSTSAMLTDISGRGLGLAIVREKVEKLGGAISVETRASVGTVFHLLLPLTLSTFRGILVRAADDIYVLPTVNVQRVLSTRQEEIRTIENREVLTVDGRTIPLVNLAAVLEIPHKNRLRESFPVVIVGSADKRIAFEVEEVLGEQEVLVKNLGKQLTRVRNIAGATISETGKIILILNVSDLMKSASKVSAALTARVEEKSPEAKSRFILVVEDSFTSRMLLKNILEAAGYNVRTAADGIDALTLLKTDGFDLVVSDVDMPRMNGFELTAKIRAEKQLSEIPVVLVTALETRADREKGIDVGANAYIEKSGFDQNNLLEAIRRLI